MRQFVIAQVGNPYIYGATGQPCTPAYRHARQAQYPTMRKTSPNTVPCCQANKPPAPADGKHYKAINDGTVWTPEEHPADWETV